MFKKVLMAGLIAAVVLSASACGKDSNEASGDAVSTPTESPAEDSQPSDAAQSEGTGTQDSAEADAQPTEEPGEEVSAAYIFSDMPIAAYEVTGLGVGLDEEVYQESIYDAENDYDLGVIPLVKLNPSNTFVLFCLLGDDDDYVSTATIHSPSGSSQWEANTYTCLDIRVPKIEGYTCDSPCLTREGTYNEEKLSGSIASLVDPWTLYIRFAEIYHPDVPERDVIHVIEVVPFSGAENYDETSEILAALVHIFEEIGATSVQEISVEEALEQCNIIVSASTAE